MGENTSVPDELAMVRLRLRELREREKLLREVLLEDVSSRDGKCFRAKVTSQARLTLDHVGLRKKYPDIADEFTNTTKFMLVKLVEIETR